MDAGDFKEPSMAALKDVGIDIAKATTMSKSDMTRGSTLHSVAIHAAALVFTGEITKSTVAEYSRDSIAVELLTVFLRDAIGKIPKTVDIRSEGVRTHPLFSAL